MASRSRKRRRRAAGPKAGELTPSAAPGAAVTPPPAPEAGARAPSESIGGWPVEPQLTRSQRRDAEVRAGLTPLAAGERPLPIVIGATVAALLGATNLVAFAAGLKIAGKHPAAGGIIVFSGLMIACAIGMWRLWYGAVLGFMALLAIVATIFALLLIEASNILGLVVPLVVVGGAGFLFFKLVRVLSRIQMPRYPRR